MAPISEAVQAEQEITYSLVDLPRAWNGPRPWCRTCEAPVEWWLWDRYADGFWGFAVRCHGAMMGGLVPEQAPGFAILETFCETEPRHPLGAWWWVDAHGNPIQDSVAFNAAMNTGTGYFRSPLGIWLRRHADEVGMVPLAFMLMLWIWSLMR